MSTSDHIVAGYPYQLAGVRGVYLLCFGHNPYKHARHYLGFSRNIARRAWQHAKGEGAPLTRALVEAGGTFHVVVLERNVSIERERALRRLHNNPVLCPYCTKRVGKDIPF